MNGLIKVLKHQLLTYYQSSNKPETNIDLSSNTLSIKDNEKNVLDAVNTEDIPIVIPKSTNSSSKEAILNSKKENILLSSEKLSKEITFDHSVFLKCFIHELYTPINSISLGVQLLKQDESSSIDKETIEDIHISLRFLQEVIKNFSVNQIVLNPFISYSLNTLIKNTIALLPQDDFRKNTIIEYAIDKDVCDTNKMDKPHLKQVLLNLLKNAIKYQDMNHKNMITIHVKKNGVLQETNRTVSLVPMQPSSPKIKKRTSSLSYDKSYTVRKLRQKLEIIIIDTNAHILPEIKTRLFETFNSTSGSGLGLYICKTILELHDATIKHDYVKPIGNCFTIEIDLETCANV